MSGGVADIALSDIDAVKLALTSLQERVAALEDENAFYKRWCAAHKKWDDACFKLILNEDGTITTSGTVS
ncbi:hypothetical protein [Hyphomicrobium sp. DY-1]|uniref:hypothetical protein n=1 Tax=Hyphomicrobium sp. DY-1 TaxID=3075650 RepID=UPI0039C4C018